MDESIVELYRRVADKAASEPLSQLLPLMLTLARQLSNPDLERWVRLEMDGYLSDNPAMNNDVIVPEYRTVVGQRSDEFGRSLIISDPRLHFVNEERLRSGAAELEHLARDTEMLTVRTPEADRIIREKLGVEVPRFTFHPSAISGVLSSIRSRLLERLDEIKPDVDRIASGSDESGARNELTKRHDSRTGLAWRYTLPTASILAIVGSVFWFATEPGFEPLIGLVVGISGLIIYKRTSNKKLDLAVSAILIVLFIAGVIALLLR